MTHVAGAVGFLISIAVAVSTTEETIRVSNMLLTQLILG